MIFYVWPGLISINPAIFSITFILLTVKEYNVLLVNGKLQKKKS